MAVHNRKIHPEGAMYSSMVKISPKRVNSLFKGIVAFILAIAELNKVNRRHFLSVF